MTESTLQAAPPLGSQSKRTKASQAANVLERSGIPLLLLLTVTYFAVFADNAELFRSSANIQNIVANQSVTGLIALGMVVPLVAGYFDVSIPAVAGLANVTSAALIATHGVPIFWGVVAAIAVALIAGAVNGLLVTTLRLDPFITTLGTYVLINGILLAYTKSRVISAGMPASIGEWGSGKWIGVARPFWVLIAVALAVWYVLTQTPFGRKLAAIGSNETAAALAGIRVKRDVFLGYLFGSFLAGLAGVVLTVRTSGADGTTASSFLFAALAAVFLGQTAVNPGYSNVWGTIFGVFFVATAVNGLVLKGADAWVTQVFNGGALVLSVTLSTVMARVRERNARNTQLEALRTS